MRLWIHIGQSKAGSTAIQRCLYDHADRLLRAGTDVHAERVSCAKWPAHYTLRGASGNLESTWRDLARAVMASACSRHIVSCEGLWLLPPDAVRVIGAVLRSERCPAGVVFVARAPLEYALSSYRWGIRRGRRPASDFRVFLAGKRDVLDYPLRLEPWRRQVGDVTTIPYERSGLVDSFLQVVQCADVLPEQESQALHNVTAADADLVVYRNLYALLPARMPSSRRVIRVVDRLAKQRWLHGVVRLLDRRPIIDAQLLAQLRSEFQAAQASADAIPSAP